VVSAVIRNELEELVQKSDRKKWPETLAILSTYGKSEEFPKLCVSLGDLLENAGDTRSASLCYMCSLSLERAVKFWRTQLDLANKKKGSLDLLALHEFVVKVSVFLKAVGPSAKFEAEDAELFSKYAEKLSEQGLFVTAAKYSRGESLESNILRDRLYRSKASPNCLAAMGGTPPEFPFTVTDVKKGRVQKTAQQNTQQNYGRQESYESTNSQQQGYTQGS
jgi:protein transport protein SEC31